MSYQSALLKSHKQWFCVLLDSALSVDCQASRFFLIMQASAGIFDIPIEKKILFSIPCISFSFIIFFANKITTNLLVYFVSKSSKSVKVTF